MMYGTRSVNYYSYARRPTKLLILYEPTSSGTDHELPKRGDRFLAIKHFYFLKHDPRPQS